MHKTRLGAAGLKGELTGYSALRIAGFKARGHFTAGKEGQESGQKGERGGIIPLTPIPVSATGLECQSLDDQYCLRVRQRKLIAVVQFLRRSVAIYSNYVT